MRVPTILLLVAIAATIPWVVSEATVPTSITVQGKLTDPGGTPLSPGAKNFTFKIYNAAVGGTEVWPAGTGEDQTISTGTDGLWIGLVGAMLPLTNAVFQDTVRWLQITVDGDVLPRVRLVTGPYAYRVATVDGASGGTITSKVSIGSGHVNTGADCFVAGNNNQATSDYATVGGGALNHATGSSATIPGGQQNVASGFASTVGGGASNTASATYATAGGGLYNNSSAYWTVVDGGYSNTASDTGAVVGGGGFNKARGPYSTVGGGGGNFPIDSNAASGGHATIGGGRSNMASGSHSTIGGGASNRVTGDYSSVAGGGGPDYDWGNYIPEKHSFIGGGSTNQANGGWSVIGGGFGNYTGGNGSTVPGGEGNSAEGGWSFAAGRNAWARHQGTFVWSDDLEPDPRFPWFESTGPQQFLVRATGGVGINRNWPRTALDVNGGLDLWYGPSTLGSTGGRIRWQNGGNPASAFGFAPDAGLWFQSDASGTFPDFGVRGPSGDSSLGPVRFVVKPNGNVGVGTATPVTATAGRVLHINADGPSVVRLGDEAGGVQWEIQSTVLDPVGAMLNFSNITDFTNPLTIRSNGNVGISSINPGNIVTVQQNSPTDPIADAWTTYSSRRWKDSIETLSNPLDLVGKLRGVRYTWKANGKRDIGLIAEEVGEVIPEVVAYEENGVDAKSVDYARLVALLIEGMKEQQQRIEELEIQVRKLAQ